VGENFNFPIPDFQCNYVCRSLSKSKQGGGIAVFIRESVAKYVSLVKMSFDTLVRLKIDHSINVCNSDLYVCCLYIPPDRSVFYRLYNCDMFCELSKQIAEMSVNGNVMLVGDMNSRCSTLDDFIQSDHLSH